MINSTNKLLILLCIILTIIIGGCYLFSNVIAPFIIATVFAYILNPLNIKVKSCLKNNSIATTVTIMIFFIFILFIFMLIIPVLYQQGVLLHDIFNLKQEIIKKKIVDFNNSYLLEIGHNLKSKVEQELSKVSAYIFQFAAKILKNILYSGITAFNMISLIFITPIVTFYLLRDWNIVINCIDKVVPKNIYKDYNKFISELDYTLSGYLQGQVSVCIFMGCFYAIILSVIGLNSGFILGILSGFLTFIPYIGAAFAATLCILVAIIQFATFLKPTIIILIFIFGQTIESNILVPKLIGTKVALHPIWIIFSLMAGGHLLGFSGVLFAIPLTAALGVFIRLLLSRYKITKFYRGK